MHGTATTLRGLAVRRTPDVELVDAAVGGDPTAFAELYRRFHTAVYAFCLSRLLHPIAADDAAQETFVRLLSAKPGTINKPLSWLFGVARHVCIDVARRHDREVVTDLSAHELPDMFSTEGCVTAREDAQRIAIALGSLNPRYRTALVMHEMHAQSALDIAKAFNIGLGATYTLLSRARDAFTAAYERTGQLPEACRRASATLYRRAAHKTSEAEEERLELHLAQCESCRLEARRFARSERVAAMRSALALPFMSPLWARVQHWAEPLAARVGPEASHAVVASAAVVAATIGVAAVLSIAPAATSPARTEPIRTDSRPASSRDGPAARCRHSRADAATAPQARAGRPSRPR